MAELRQVEQYEDGRYDIVTTGTTRFRLRGMNESMPYLQGDVDFLEEAGGTDAEVLVPGVTRLLGAYRQALLSAQGMTGELPELPTDPIVLSYLIAAAMVLDLSDKQRLLKTPGRRHPARARADLATARSQHPVAAAVDARRRTHPGRLLHQTERWGLDHAVHEGGERTTPHGCVHQGLQTEPRLSGGGQLSAGPACSVTARQQQW